MDESTRQKREKVSNLIENYRIDHKMTQQQLAAHMNNAITESLDILSNITKASIYQWESQSNVPNTITMAVISKYDKDADLARLATEIVNALEGRD